LREGLHAPAGGTEETQRVTDESFPIEEAAAQRAVQLDPMLAGGYAVLGILEMRRGKGIAAEQLYRKALALDPNDPQALTSYSNLLAGAGHLKEALAMKRKLLALEPLVPQYNANAATHFWLNGENDTAIATARNLPPEFSGRAELLAQLYASMGRYGDAAEALQTIAPDSYVPGTVEQAVRLMRMAPKPVSSPETLPRLGYLSFVYLFVGAPERALEYFEAEAQAGDLVPVFYAVVWHPSYPPVRKTERFRKFARDAGLVEYWKAKGWPEFCHPTTGDDFACS
jgi:Flp pilus assembly protein TadD